MGDKQYTQAMNFEIKNLVLYEALVFSKDETAPIIKTEELSVFESGVKKNDMNPEQSRFLIDGKWCGYGLKPGAKLKEGQAPDGVIPEGKYLFVQFFADPKDEKQHMFEAAEALFLEASWQEVNLKDTVYVRTLEEGDKKVVQIFREKIQKQEE